MNARHSLNMRGGRLATRTIPWYLGELVSQTAGLVSGGMVLMINALPLEKRPAWMGAVGATTGITSVVGPLLLGGVLTTNVSWRRCFYSKFDQSSSMTNKRTNERSNQNNDRKQSTYQSEP